MPALSQTLSPLTAPIGSMPQIIDSVLNSEQDTILVASPKQEDSTMKLSSSHSHDGLEFLGSQHTTSDDSITELYFISNFILNFVFSPDQVCGRILT